MNARTVMETVDFLAARGIRTWIVRQVPEPGVDVPRALALALVRGRSIDQIGTTHEQFIRERQAETAAFGGLSEESVAIIDPLDWFFSAGAVGRVAAGGRALYSDSNHLSRTGALYLMPMLSSAFLEIGQDRNRGT